MGTPEVASGQLTTETEIADSLLIDAEGEQFTFVDVPISSTLLNDYCGDGDGCAVLVLAYWDSVSFPKALARRLYLADGGREWRVSGQDESPIKSGDLDDGSHEILIDLEIQSPSSAGCALLEKVDPVLPIYVLRAGGDVAFPPHSADCVLKITD